MFKKRFFRRGNKPGHSNFLESGEKQQEQSFIPPVQTKLAMGKPGDRYETEADNMADRVVNNQTQGDSVQKVEEDEENVQAKPLANAITPVVQRQTEIEEEEPVQAKAEEEEEKEVQMQSEEEDIQMQPEEEEEMVQQKSSGNLRISPKSFENQLKQSNSKGESLSSKIKEEMEKGFGANFSKIRIHNDKNADDMNRTLGARAFTHGRDIYFKKDQFNPDNQKGKLLLAHELTHTIQQGAVKVSDSPQNISSHSIQRAEIPYRQLTWDDFEASPESESDFDAYTYSGAKFNSSNFINGAYSPPGEEVTLTVTYNASNISYYGFMETDLSWKKNWLTNDAAAREKWGEGEDIEAHRNSLLAHEQTHFRISKAIAEKYEPLIRAAIPSEATTRVVEARNNEAAQTALRTFIQEKNTEIMSLIQSVIGQAEAERQALQGIYDDQTDHSQETQQQQHWQDNFDEAMEHAMRQASGESTNQEDNGSQEN